MTTPTDTQDQDSNLHESVYFKTETQDDISLCVNGCYCMTHTIDGKCGKCEAAKTTDTQVSAEQLEAIAKRANWEQAKVVYAAEIEKLLISARLDELNEIVSQSANIDGVTYGDINHRIAELTKQLEDTQP